jgi:hypothetical protein
LLTTQSRFGEGSGGGDEEAEEIDAGRCDRGAPAAGRFGERRRSSGRRIFMRAERTAREDARRSRRWSPATRSVEWPAMARRRDPPGGGARVWDEEKGCGSAGECEGGNTGALGGLL